MVFLPRVEYEKHVCSNAKARADQWTPVHLDARLPAFWHRGGESLIPRTIFQKTRDCQSIAGFSLLTQNQRERNKMKTNENRVPARFGPETRFEVRPAPPAPFRAMEETEFERLKGRLLTRHLAEVPAPELITPLRRAANDAAALAWATVVPLLVFPVLFEVKIADALRHTARQACIRERSRELLAV
jgi:hypothetical protein